MRAALPTDLLLRLMNATPEQYAGVRRALGLSTCEEGGWWMDDGGLLRNKWSRSQRPSPVVPTPSPAPAGEGPAEKDNDEGGQSFHPPSSTCHPHSDSDATAAVARAAFALLAKLDVQGKHRRPSPLTVFRLYCIEGLSADQVALRCRCAKGTVMGRLQFIERATRMRPEKFRALSGHLQELAENYDRSGAREIYRRGLAAGE